MVELKDDDAKKFITNVGLITSRGSEADNIMSAEWTHQISYKPGLIAVSIGPEKATAANIKESKEFGVNLASVDQTVLSSVAGGTSGWETDKIKALESLGFKFYPAKKIKCLMVDGSSLNIECKLVKEVTLGDHILFIGEVLSIQSNNNEPLAYHKGMYWKMEEPIPKISQEQKGKIKEIINRFERDISD